MFSKVTDQLHSAQIDTFDDLATVRREAAQFALAIYRKYHSLSLDDIARRVVWMYAAAEYQRLNVPKRKRTMGKLDLFKKAGYYAMPEMLYNDYFDLYVWVSEALKAYHHSR